VQSTYDTAIALSEGLGVPVWQAMSQAQAMSNSSDPKLKGYGVAISDEWKTVMLQNRIGELGSKARSTADPDERAKLREEARELEAQIPSGDQSRRNVLGRIGLGAVNLAGQQVATVGSQLAAPGRNPNLINQIGDTIYEFTKNALTFQFRKQAQLLTKTATQATGIGRQEGGSAYWKMIDAGVPHELAGPYSDTAGAINSGIELLSDATLVKLLGPFKGKAKSVLKVLGERLGWDGALTQLAVRAAAKVIGGGGQELGEELTQETTTFLAEKAARIQAESEGYSVEQEQDLASRYKQVFQQWPTFLAAGILPGLTEGIRGIGESKTTAKTSGAAPAAVVTPPSAIRDAVEQAIDPTAPPEARTAATATVESAFTEAKATMATAPTAEAAIALVEAAKAKDAIFAAGMAAEQAEAQARAVEATVEAPPAPTEAVVAPEGTPAPAVPDTARNRIIRENPQATVHAEVIKGEWVASEVLAAHAENGVVWAQEEKKLRGELSAMAADVVSSGGTVDDFVSQVQTLTIEIPAIAEGRGARTINPELIKTQEYYERVYEAVPKPVLEEIPASATPFERQQMETQNADAQIDQALKAEESSRDLWWGKSRVDNLTAETAEGYTGNIRGIDAETVKNVIGDMSVVKQGTDEVTELNIRKKVELAKALITGFMHKATAGIGGRAATQLAELQKNWHVRISKNIREAQTVLYNYGIDKNSVAPPTVRRVLDAKAIEDLTVGELRSLYEQAQAIREEGLKATKAKVAEWKAETAKVKEQARLEAAANKPKKTIPQQRGGKAEAKMQRGPGLIGKANFANLRPNRWPEMVGATFKKYLWTAFKNGVGESKVNAVRRLTAWHEKMKSLGVKESDIKRVFTVGGNLYNGAEGLGVYILSQNEDTHNSLTDPEGNNFTEQHIEDFKKAIGPKMMALGDYMIDSYRGNDLNRLMEFAMDEVGVPFKVVENYFPKVGENPGFGVNPNAVIEEFKTRYPQAGLGAMPKDFLKSRTGAVVKLHLNAMQIFENSIKEQERLMGLYRAVKMANSIMADKEVNAQLTRAYGRDIVDMMKKHIVHSANPASMNTMEPMMRALMKLRGRIIAGGITLNPTTILKNLPIIGILQYSRSINAKTAVKGMLQGITNRAFGTDETLYDFVTSRDPFVLDRLMDQVFESIKADEWVRLAGIQNVQQKFAELGSKLLGAVDGATILQGWKAVYDTAIDEGLSEAEAVERAQEETLKVQPQGDAIVLPYILKTDAGRLAHMLYNQLNQNANMMADMNLYKKNDPKSAARTIQRTVFTAKTLSGLVTTGIVMGVIGRKRLPRKDDGTVNFKELATDILSTFVAAVPFIGDPLSSLIEGRGIYGSQSAYVGPLYKAAQGVAKAAEGVKDADLQEVLQGVYAVLPEVIRVMGGPAVLISRTIKAINEASLWPLFGGKPERKE
jgi:hypothetical protein